MNFFNIKYYFSNISGISFLQHFLSFDTFSSFRFYLPCIWLIAIDKKALYNFLIFLQESGHQCNTNIVKFFQTFLIFAPNEASKVSHWLLFLFFLDCDFRLRDNIEVFPEIGYNIGKSLRRLPQVSLHFYLFLFLLLILHLLLYFFSVFMLLLQLFVKLSVCFL